MRLALTILTIFGLYIGCSAIKGYKPAKVTTGRYVIFFKDVIGTQSFTDTKIKVIKDFITEGKVTTTAILEDLKYQTGFVAVIDSDMAQKVRTQFDAIVEKDIVFTINDGTDEVVMPSVDDKTASCGNQPPPIPPPTNPGDCPGYPRQPIEQTPWGIYAVKANTAWPITEGQGVKVCVVDTGIDPCHPDLIGQVIFGEDNTGTGSWVDDHSHGTHVSGTIAALKNGIGVIGVAPGAKLLAEKVLDRDGSGYSSWVANGILGCVRQNAEIISMSLGSKDSATVIQDAVNIALAKGIKVIAAAGNDNGPVGYPAAYPGVIAVSAIDSEHKKASFSSYGPEIKYAAPGVNVRSSVLNGEYADYNGTSMATPHVSGVMALVLSAKKNQILAIDIGLDKIFQGDGLPDSYLSVK